MKILLTGANGYVGRRLLPVLVMAKHKVVCLVRDKRRLVLERNMRNKVEILEMDLTDEEALHKMPNDIDVAYYLVHSLSHTSRDERLAAKNFVKTLEQGTCKQMIYLGHLANNDILIKQFRTWIHVEEVLRMSKIPLTVLRSTMILGSGSAIFEILRDLVEKSPIMLAPDWVMTRCQPIDIKNVVIYLAKSAGNKKVYHKVFDIGGPAVMTYYDMLMIYAEERGLRRKIVIVPALPHRLSARWLRSITSTTLPIARYFVGSMKNEVVVNCNGIEDVIRQPLLNYREMIRTAFKDIKQNEVVSSWMDACCTGKTNLELVDFVQVPIYGCFQDRREADIEGQDPDVLFNRIWEIGGDNGWYGLNFIWRIRGFFDRVFGGPGLRRGRRSQTDLKPGDALDFWRVLMADKSSRRLLLYSELKTPGEAWLEFKVKPTADGCRLQQSLSYRPKGLSGRLYWHFFQFIRVPAMRSLISSLAEVSVKEDGATSFAVRRLGNLKIHR
ncbi:epimerase [Fulvitalea axinellae]|uniref:Epimerase n=1 Tax=Fulvitalea axinellae TaxID=1182444 RepID=A0AAU9CGI0_9BACT|nr:epimerase [Fulvitalea axinellae]